MRTVPRLSSIRLVCLFALVAGLASCRSQTLAPVPLPVRVEAAYRALDASFDQDDAFGIVLFMDRSWRLAGNPGFDATVDHLREGLEQGGFTAGRPAEGGAPGPRVWVEEYPNDGHGWDYERGRVELLGAGGQREVVLSREKDRVSLCINSFSTPAGGLRAPLVDVGDGTSDADYEGKTVKGAVVLGDGPVGRLWRAAVQQRGAAGVISTSVPGYIRPASPEAFTHPDQWDVFQWGSIPYDDTLASFAFKASLREATRLRQALAAGPAEVMVDIASSFHDGPSRTVVAEIPGAARPDERIVMAAHIQEPGANDDATGCGTLYELARTLAEGVAAGRIPPPGRTLTFLWGDEIRSSRQWLADHQDQAKGVQYMLSLDMTGEDVTKTGGTFLIEKQPDPSAVWDEPSDPHTAWGASEVKADSLKGSLLDDVHLAVCARRTKDTGWVVRTNPYEGGSDHTVFGEAGIPALLDWHFTDRYYHTNLDRPDKTSPAEMKNVGVAVGVTAWWLASADQHEAEVAAAVVAQAAARRLALERTQSAAILAAATDRGAAEAAQAALFEAWKKWYVEALQSVLRLPVTRVDPGFRRTIDLAVEQLRNETR